MPEDKFADAVKPALEALLVDLQNTTEILRRSHLGRNSESREDIEPIYVDQKKRTPDCSPVESLNDVETLVNRYSEDRQRNYGGASTSRPTLESLVGQLDLHDDPPSPSSRRSLHNGNSYGDLRRSTSRDPLRSDSMLGTLNSDTLSSKHGVSTIPKGDCAYCSKPIIGQVVIALGKMWHPEHYRCCECGEELGHRNFFERGGKAYCEDDYHKLFSPRCSACNGAIRDRCVSALGKQFHIEHFTCEECGREFGDDGFHEKNGRPYCREDFFRLFAPKCHGCSSPIKDNFITALGTHWHPNCFVCQRCGCSFEGGSFFDAGGEPLCETHYHEKRGSLCASCRHPISGRCVTALGQKFHPEHFRCTYCNRQLTKGTFKEVNQRPFCHKCWDNTHNGV
ncbi:hypothetical protein PENTCL1PPCAC_11684 [Pristionchus entomophagus]|uniref:LIM zinc-binding domain-containing protein n=1 Tax=Pristionchus entomophagus TaxID=358040 RepID=A0AAV5T2N0_9BILA|nr:hypothetical protein PENTCL1PPCAC_11684 [Pristionchus entomophagus]